MVVAQFLMSVCSVLEQMVVETVSLVVFEALVSVSELAVLAVVLANHHLTGRVAGNSRFLGRQGNMCTREKERYMDMLSCGYFLSDALPKLS